MHVPSGLHAPQQDIIRKFVIESTELLILSVCFSCIYMLSNTNNFTIHHSSHFVCNEGNNDTYTVSKSMSIRHTVFHTHAG